MDSAPLQTRLLLSFAVATFIAALASVWVLAEVRGRVEALKRAPAAPAAPPAAPPRPAVREPGAFPPPKEAPEAGAPGPLDTKDPLAKLDHLIKALQEQTDSAYDYYSDLMGDLVAIKREIRQLKATVRNLSQAVQQGRPGALSLGWGLAPRGAPLSGEIAKAFVADAERFGIRVEPGRVTARAMLNMSPNKQMPIEYFITRYPESGHETLVHLVGPGTLGGEPHPFKQLQGLGTALYKALLAAGFKEGESSHLEEPPAPADASETPKEPDAERREPAPAPPKLVLATGDVVYLYVRYTLKGQTHLARATDWVLDPSTGTVLPEDCFRFTGSQRVPDPETGEEMVAAEMGGLLVSVWPNAGALLEVALDSSVHNDYQYNSSRIPKPYAPASPDAAPPAAGQAPPEPLWLDLIFSATPLATEGDGAAPLSPPAAPVPAGGR